eukprot:19939-Heterococcus_DN1.PRE.1
MMGGVASKLCERSQKVHSALIQHIVHSASGGVLEVAMQHAAKDRCSSSRTSCRYVVPTALVQSMHGVAFAISNKHR